MSDIYLKLHSGPQPAADWTTQNPNLAQFEMGVESDTGLFKINWTSTPTAWADLGYANQSSGSVSDTAYDATSWNGVTTVAPSKNAVRDKFESLSAVPVKAIGAEINTGTDDAKFVTAKAIKDSNLRTESIIVPCGDRTTAITATTNVMSFRMPYAFKLTGIRASLVTAQASGNIFTVDVNEAGTSVISTKLTIDNTENSSTTAAAPPVISDADLADDALISVDVDQIGNGSAAGLIVTLIGYQP